MTFPGALFCNSFRFKDFAAGAEKRRKANEKEETARAEKEGLARCMKELQKQVETVRWYELWGNGEVLKIDSVLEEQCVLGAVLKGINFEWKLLLVGILIFGWEGRALC